VPPRPRTAKSLSFYRRKAERLGFSQSFFRARRGTFNARIEGFGKSQGFVLDKFVAGANRLFARLEATLEQREAGIAALQDELFEKIVRRTPVDTGRARAGWKPPEERREGKRRTWVIENDVEYVIYLEYGWSRQAPLGMVRISMAEMAAKVRKLLAGVEAGGRA